ncbi:hypothetical protein Nepgr_031179 [Nepenthes gracilis]|uniref:DUF6821 domain-containing protein n=1 Tax=Nepenthes gracilis TaxID=150966 RepID=A0AAD3THL9_NEPGR|nr:hypothetical protein Nepgr_031179 [Nepenthes gracilis]
MDLEEWEFLSDDGFIDLHEDGVGRKVREKVSLHSNSIIDMNYFQRFIEPREKNSRVVNHVVAVPIQLDPAISKGKADESIKKVSKTPRQITLLQLENSEAPETVGALESEQETISQVFFKKMKENEFVDMKLDSPRSSNRGFSPPIDVGMHQFGEKEGNFNGESAVIGKKEAVGKEKSSKSPNLDGDDDEELACWEDNNGGLSLLKKWGMTGIGAICSFGFAAATFCIIVLGSRQNEKHHRHNQKLQFQIYAHDKGIKEVVHRATRLNEAISAVRGAPLTRAHITVGGYFEGL